MRDDPPRPMLAGWGPEDSFGLAPLSRSSFGLLDLQPLGVRGKKTALTKRLPNRFFSAREQHDTVVKEASQQ